MLISNVSDTARWVAMYRALESERPDALFKDAWARRLAGERGQAILDGMPRGREWGWPMVVRTAVMDEIILKEVAAGADLVVNLAAGLDMRPYRLSLPSSLRWAEADLPEILDEKTAMVAGEKPACRLERIPADLADASARRSVLARVSAGRRRALIITEGLLIYLESAQVEALAKDLAASPAAQRWLIDIASPRLIEMMRGSWGKVTAAGGAPFKFAPPEHTKFFEPFGWREFEFRSTFAEALRLHRAPGMAWFWRLMMAFAPPKGREMWSRFSGVALLERI